MYLEWRTSAEFNILLFSSSASRLKLIFNRKDFNVFTVDVKIKQVQQFKHMEKKYAMVKCATLKPDGALG